MGAWGCESRAHHWLAACRRNYCIPSTAAAASVAHFILQISNSRQTAAAAAAARARLNACVFFSWRSAVRTCCWNRCCCCCWSCGEYIMACRQRVCHAFRCPACACLAGQQRPQRARQTARPTGVSARVRADALAVRRLFGRTNNSLYMSEPAIWPARTIYWWRPQRPTPGRHPCRGAQSARASRDPVPRRDLSACHRTPPRRPRAATRQHLSLSLSLSPAAQQRRSNACRRRKTTPRTPLTRACPRPRRTPGVRRGGRAPSRRQSTQG